MIHMSRKGTDRQTDTQKQKHIDDIVSSSRGIIATQHSITCKSESRLLQTSMGNVLDKTDRPQKSPKTEPQTTLAETYSPTLYSYIGYQFLRKIYMSPYQIRYWLSHI